MGDPFVSIPEIRKNVEVHEEVPSWQTNGIGTIEDTDVSQLMRDGDTKREGYGTDNAFENRAEKITNVFINGASAFLSDFDDPSPTETTHNSEEV